MSEQKIKNGSILDIKLVGALFVCMATIGAPFVALGGYKERLEILEKNSQASEIEIRAHASEDYKREIDLSGRLSAIEQQIQGNVVKLLNIDEKLDAMWRYVRSNKSR